MKLFGRSGGYYLFWTGFVYFWIGTYLAFTHAGRPEIATATWVCVLALPFVIPPLGRYFNLDVEWDRKMIGWRKRQIADKVAEDIGDWSETDVAPEKPVKEPKTYYTFGLTDDNRLSFTMGYTTLTMNRPGVQHLIDQLEFFKNQLPKEDKNVQ